MPFRFFLGTLRSDKRTMTSTATSTNIPTKRKESKLSRESNSSSSQVTVTYEVAVLLAASTALTMISKELPGTKTASHASRSITPHVGQSKKVAPPSTEYWTDLRLGSSTTTHSEGGVRVTIAPFESDLMTTTGAVASFSRITDTDPVNPPSRRMR